MVWRVQYSEQFGQELAAAKLAWQPPDPEPAVPGESMEVQCTKSFEITEWPAALLIAEAAFRVT